MKHFGILRLNNKEEFKKQSIHPENSHVLWKRDHVCYSVSFRGSKSQKLNQQSTEIWFTHTFGPTSLFQALGSARNPIRHVLLLLRKTSNSNRSQRCRLAWNLWCTLYIHIIYLEHSRTLMTLVLVGKGLVLGGWPSKLEVSWVLGIYMSTSLPLLWTYFIPYTATGMACNAVIKFFWTTL